MSVQLFVVVVAGILMITVSSINTKELRKVLCCDPKKTHIACKQSIQDCDENDIEVNSIPLDNYTTLWCLSRSSTGFLLFPCQQQHDNKTVSNQAKSINLKIRQKCCPAGFIYSRNETRCLKQPQNSIAVLTDQQQPPVALITNKLKCGEQQIYVEYNDVSSQQLDFVYDGTLLFNNKRYMENEYCVEMLEETFTPKRFLLRICEHATICTRIPCMRRCCGIGQRYGKINGTTHCMVAETDTVVFMGETGSGKTTQLPQYLLEDGYGRSGMIGITQPRRVAAITIAKRVAQEQNCQLGTLVGYTVRFEDCTGKDTKIRYMTDGSLLREALTDRLLKNYSVLMLDEVHERTINSDVLLGIAKEAQKRRRAEGMTPLKLIITSATMDIDNFCAYFKVPGMYLEGREHPVRVFHVKQKQSDYMMATLSTLFQVHRELPLDHDILVFLTGQEEIESMSQTLRHFAKDNTEDMRPVRIFPLYAQLPQPKQLECFMPAPANARKIILATNIAETSITIPGIRCVIDSGYVKRRIYNAETALDVLRVTRISQAQAWQRSGRAGRDSAGTCYRMYTMQQMEEMDEMPQPELLRSNLSSTVLQLMALGIDCKNFDFLDKPDGAAIDNAYKMLTTLGAVKKLESGKHELTAVGRRMVQFPLDPQYSKLLLVAPQFGCLEEMIKLVAMLSSENVFITPQEKRELASLAHSKFQHESGDHLTLLNVFNAYLKTDKVKTWCHDNFINIRNITYASEVRLQLIEIARRLNLQMKSCDEDLDKVKKCLLAALFDNIAKLQRDNTYFTISGRQTTRLHPSSIFHGKYRPKYIIYTDILHTQRIFLRQVTEIQRDWISEVVPNYPYLNRIF